MTAALVPHDVAAERPRAVARAPVAPALAPARFVFILSPERSGSTLLSAMLAGHSRAVAPAELHLLRYPTVGAWRKAYPAASGSLDALLEVADVAPGDLDDAESPTALYRRLQRRAPRGSLLVDKTPAYARSLEALRAAESLRPLYVWLVRHPLGVAASRVSRLFSNRRARNDGWLPWAKYPAFWLRESLRDRRGDSARALAEDWAEVHGRLRRFFQEEVDEDRVLRLHYEELLGEPVPQLRKLCDFLDLDLEPSMLDPRANAPKGLRWGVGDENVLRHAGIEASRAGGWRQRYDESLLSPRVRLLAEALGVRLDATASVGSSAAERETVEVPVLQTGQG